MIALQASHALGNHAAQSAHQWGCPAFGQRDGQTQLAADRGNLGTGKPAADHQHAAWLPG